MITKESGESGFFEEKIAPALAAGVPVYMITRPALPEHYEYVYGPVGLRKAVERLCPELLPAERRASPQAALRRQRQQPPCMPSSTRGRY